ncbi:MAG: hypothetical protein R3F21_22215 [Myxococcota bacterium]
MNREEARKKRANGSEGGSVEQRAWVSKRLLALMVVAATASGLMSMSGCRERSDMDEAMEEIGDEIDDSKKEIQDEIDDHT